MQWNNDNNFWFLTRNKWTFAERKERKSQPRTPYLAENALSFKNEGETNLLLEKQRQKKNRNIK